MKKTSQAGQSTIEFILCFSFGVSIILLVFNSAMNYTTGYLVHYATFMASRTYLTAELYGGNAGNTTTAKAESEARDTFDQYQLGVFDVPSSALNFNSPGNLNASEYLLVGAYTSFTKNIDALGQVTGQATLNYVSESFLGKEPTRAICLQRVCHAITGGNECQSSDDFTVFDDGC